MGNGLGIGLGNGLGNGLGIGLGNVVLSAVCEDVDLHVAIFIRGESSLHAEITTLWCTFECE